MNEYQLLEAVSNAGIDIGTEKGSLTLFGLFARADGFGRDLIVSAPWANSFGLPGYHYVNEKLKARLTQEQFASILRIELLEPKTAFVQEILQRLPPNAGMGSIVS